MSPQTPSDAPYGPAGSLVTLRGLYVAQRRRAAVWASVEAASLGASEGLVAGNLTRQQALDVVADLEAS